MAKIKSVEDKTMSEIIEFEKHGLKMVSLKGNEEPKSIVAKINEFVSDTKEGNQRFSEDEILALGILLGWQYVKGLNWHWGEVIWGLDQASSAIGVLNEDNSLFNNPMAWMNNVLITEKVPNFMLNYNMVAAGNVPKGQPNEAMSFH